MTPLLQGQVAILTGAGRGIGAASARLLARHGARVVVSDRDEVPAARVAEEIALSGGHAIAVAGDITDPDFPRRLLEKTAATFGALNILVNNAGYTWDGMLHKMSDRQWQAMLEVHNTAPFRLLREAAPYLRDPAKTELAEGRPQQPRCIVNVSSTSGLHGNPGQANYSTAKLGIVGLTKTVAKEWGPFGIRCNAVAFGYIETRLTAAKETGETISVEGEEVHLGIPGLMKEALASYIPLGRAGTVDEAAGAILFLASPLASYVNGHVLEVTGGMGI